MLRPSAPRAVVAGVIAGAVATATFSALRLTTLRSRTEWTRRNYRDRDVSLLLGPAVGAGAVAGLLAAGPPSRRTALLVVASAAAVGAYDDVYGDTHARGLLGHAAALRERRVTTGVVKAVALATTAAVGATVTHRRAVDVALGTVLVAGGANLINLFDVRPGRAGKVTLMIAAPLLGAGAQHARAVGAVAAGAAVAALPVDLGEQAMLGDCGASTLGALLGWSASVSGSRRRRTILALAVIGLTAASERVSFTTVIADRPILRALDQLGRQSG
jgi:UDP-GlcNAc:undecaprenyl-phosphate/decaprenyl-phosphate GlcNAc-1-phosphate transferase